MVTRSDKPPRGRLPESFVSDLLGRVDIAEIVGSRVVLKKQGANLLGLCPFHGEKSPSFTVSPSKQFFHCFGCGKNGDAIAFLQEMQGLDFREAVEELAQHYGVSIPAAAEDPAAARARQERNKLRSLCAEANRAAARHYFRLLRTAERALNYLQDRQLPLRELQERFIIGYAPAQWDGLRPAFPDYDTDLTLVSSGLVVQDQDSGRRHDRFRDRVIFGIRNLKGEVVGFGGRLLGEGKPKYLNSPETPIFDKSRELFGIYEARQAIQANGQALLVEGYVDVLALAGAGFGEAVATMGTACTVEHLRALLRLAPRVIFCFDGDEAGKKAAWKAMQTALPLAGDNCEFRFLLVPAALGKDPDDVIKNHGKAQFEDLLADSTPLSEYLVSSLKARHNQLKALEDSARFAAEAEGLLALMPASRFGKLLREQVQREATLHLTPPGAVGTTEGPVIAQPRAALDRLLPTWAQDQAGRAIQALAAAVRSQPATAQKAAEGLLGQLSAGEQQAFFDGNMAALPAFERPLWEALHAACRGESVEDALEESGTAQRDLLLSGAVALTRARAQHRKLLLVRGLRQGAIAPSEFARAAVGAAADASTQSSDAPAGV
jgi:DNA primase